MYCILFFLCVFLIFDVIFSITKGVQHDGRLLFWKPASMLAYHVCIVVASAFGGIIILFSSLILCDTGVCLTLSLSRDHSTGRIPFRRGMRPVECHCSANVAFVSVQITFCY